MDLTSFFFEAEKLAFEFSNQDHASLLKLFVKNSQYYLDWDLSDGESWGRIIDKESVIIIFHSHLPLMFIAIDYYNTFNRFLNDLRERIVIVPVDNWDTKNYSINLALLSSRIIWHSTINPSNISINDLWYSTV